MLEFEDQEEENWIKIKLHWRSINKCFCECKFTKIKLDLTVTDIVRADCYLYSTNYDGSISRFQIRSSRAEDVCHIEQHSIDTGALLEEYERSSDVKRLEVLATENIWNLETKMQIEMFCFLMLPRDGTAYNIRSRSELSYQNIDQLVLVPLNRWMNECIRLISKKIRIRGRNIKITKMYSWGWGGWDPTANPRKQSPFSSIFPFRWEKEDKTAKYS